MRVHRREFLRYAGSAGIIPVWNVRSGVGDVRFSEDNLIDGFGMALVDPFDEDISREDIVEPVEQTVDLACYITGLGDEGGDDFDGDLGVVERFQRYELADIVRSNEFLDWFARNIEEVAEVLGSTGFVPDNYAERFAEVGEKISKKSKYIPVIGRLKAVLDSGCHIHGKLEDEERVAEEAYIRFLKNAALLTIEILLLISGFGASYRVAFSAAGRANMYLINTVGRTIGWRAYSWVLSQIHWIVRVAFSESFGLVIEDTVDEVTRIVVSDAELYGDVELAQDRVRSQVTNQVERIALAQSSGLEKEVYLTQKEVDNMLSEPWEGLQDVIDF
jgi:hypothetical protein